MVSGQLKCNHRLHRTVFLQRSTALMIQQEHRANVFAMIWKPAPALAMYWLLMKEMLLSCWLGRSGSRSTPAFVGE
jgi:hypothetical protein